MSFFREQKFLAALLIASLLVLAAGLFMIQQSKTQPEVVAEQALTSDEEKAVVAMNLMAEAAQRALNKQQVAAEHESESAAHMIGDIKPQESIDRVAALNGRVPEIGSDDWCEVMMVKDGKDWTPDEQALFAKHCL
jgi:Tfp pilus assembly protein PilW